VALVEVETDFVDFVFVMTVEDVITCVWRLELTAGIEIGVDRLDAENDLGLEVAVGFV
jgi:hypothetical protein